MKGMKQSLARQNSTLPQAVLMKVIRVQVFFCASCADTTHQSQIPFQEQSKHRIFVVSFLRLRMYATFGSPVFDAFSTLALG